MKRFCLLALVCVVLTGVECPTAAAVSVRVKTRCRRVMTACLARGKKRIACRKKLPRVCRNAKPRPTPTPGARPRISEALDASAGGPYAAVIGSAVDIVGSASGGSGGYHFSWDLDNNGSFESTGRKVSFEKPDAGEYVVRLHVADDGGRKVVRTGKVVVSSHAGPRVSLSGDSSGEVNKALSFTALVDHPLGGSYQSSGFTMQWSFGDGSPEQRASDLYSVNHAFARAGTYTVQAIARDRDGIPSTAAARTVTVRDASAAILPIPELSRWESQMISYGKLNCARMTDPSMTDDKKLSDTYYDSQWVFYQIADYTHDAFWNGCAESASAIYRDTYAIPNGGRIPGYWNFTHGLMFDYLRNGDVTSKNAAILISQQAAYVYDGTAVSATVDASFSREVAYGIMGFLNAETLGQPRRSRLAPFVDQALGHIDQWVLRKTAPYVRPFMVALTAHALISWYDVSGDERVLPALRAAADYIWSACWLPASGAFQYTDRSIGNSDDLLPAPDLNLLIAPVYAWLYHKTGETKFRDEGDAIFAGGVKGAYLVGGKQFNQSYRMSFEYVRLRSLPPLK